MPVIRHHLRAANVILVYFLRFEGSDDDDDDDEMKCGCNNIFTLLPGFDDDEFSNLSIGVLQTRVETCTVHE